MEIPVSYHAIAHRQLNQIDQGSRPFVIPDKAYDQAEGLLIDEAQPTNYRSYYML